MNHPTYNQYESGNPRGTPSGVGRSGSPQSWRGDRRPLSPVLPEMQKFPAIRIYPIVSILAERKSIANEEFYDNRKLSSCVWSLLRER